jgi:uncharacterized membrane protein
MISLVIAAIFFDGIHFFVSGTPLRAAIVERTGEKVYQALFSLVSVVGLVWLGWAYAGAERVELWKPAALLYPVSAFLTLLAFLLVAIGITTPNPTAVGGEAALREDVAAKGILRVTRHPFLSGIAIWALAHILVAGDLAALVFFGALLVLAMVGPGSIDAKRARAFGDEWKRFSDATSRVPFVAIFQGRNTLELAEIGWWRIAVALVLYAVFLGAHSWLFGVSPFSQ